MKGILAYTKPRDRTGKKNALLMNELLLLSLMLLILCLTKRISALILCYHLQKKLKHSYHEKSYLLPNNFQSILDLIVRRRLFC